MKRLCLLFVVALGVLPGCVSPPPPQRDPVEYDRQMKSLNEEVLRQEGKLPTRRP